MLLVELGDKIVNARLVTLNIVDANRVLLGCKTPSNSFPTERLSISYVLQKLPGYQLLHSTAGTRHNSRSFCHMTDPTSVLSYSLEPRCAAEERFRAPSICILVDE